MEENPDVEEKPVGLTYGEEAVGISFNPSSSSEVDAIKRFYANIIDKLNDKKREESDKPREEVNGELLRLLSIAITEAQTAQMWAVKAITWS